LAMFYFFLAQTPRSSWYVYINAFNLI
jgi:hypothetical protein